MAPAEQQQQSRAVQNAHPERWVKQQRASPQRRVQFRVALAAAKSDAELAQVVASLSDITSSAYGQYLQSSEELKRHWAPRDDSTQAIRAFLDGFKGVDAHANELGDYWTLHVDAATAESMFATQLYEFTHHKDTSLKVVRPHANYTIPNAIADHVVYIDGLESFPTEMQAQYMAKGSRHAVGQAVRRVNQNGDPFAIKHDIVEFDHVSGKKEVITPAIVRAQYEIPEDVGTFNGTHALNKLVIGTFLHEFYTEADLKTFLSAYDPVYATTNPKMPMTKGDCIAGLPTSMASKPTGEASLDIQVVASIARSENVEMLCYTNLRDDSRPQAADNQEPFLTFLQEVNAMSPPPAVVSISYTDDECSVPQQYALAVNRELMKSAMKGITVVISAGDAGSQGSHLADFCKIDKCSQFLANFPASSPYVTAVGATSIDTGARDLKTSKYREIVTSIEDGALITSGGGFSVLFPRPTYQDKAVASYLKLAGDNGLSPFFNTKGRAYPDVTGLGHAFPVYESGKMYPTDGTSVSAPLLASMVVLINKVRLEAGQPVLGFLNPLLYQLYDVCPHVFADITEGDISCGSPDMGCCPKGHVAAEGWDATSGVGTVRLTQFVNDLDGCMALIRAKAVADLNLSQQQEHINLLADTSRDFTTSQRQAAQLLFSVALIAGVALISVLVSLRSNLFSSRLRFHRNIREPAREYLLARDQSRA